MNPEATLNPTKNMAFLRSNSIRNHQTPTSTRPLQPINLSLKVNQKHFPIDFFKRIKRNSIKNKENLVNLNQDKITMTQRRQGLQHFHHLLSENKNNNICYKEQIVKSQDDVDGFQITSFFQIGVDSVDTVDTVDVQDRVEVSDFDCGLTNQISNSIELINNKKQQDLLITFSRIPRLPSSRPPRKHANNLQPTNTQSTPIPRSSSKREDRKQQNHKNSMHKIIYENKLSQLENENENEKQKSKSIRKITKKGETINLPPICRKN